MGGTCLIVGGSGFVGRWLRAALLEGGFRVRSFDRQSSGAGDEVIGDVLDPEAVRRACDGVNVVCHLVAQQSSRDHTWEDFQRLNVRSTELLLDASVRQGVAHFVYFSTELVYGRQWTERVDENAVLRPAGFYGKSKRMAEELCQARAAAGMAMTILRPCNIMGPGRLRVVDQLFERVQRNAPIPMVGGGKQPCQIADVRDVAAIVREIVERRIVGLYNVGTTAPPTVRAVYARLLERAGSRSPLVPLPGWLFRSAALALDRVGLSPLTPDQYQRLADSWTLDTEKLFAAITYRPQYDELRAIVDTYDAFVAAAPSPLARSVGRGARRRTALDLHDRVVLVTGASRGIGRATALEFARCGARVAMTARSADALAGVQAEIAARGGEALALPADLRDSTQVRALVAEIVAAWGRIDILVNNAGVTHKRWLADMTEDEIQDIVSTNLLATVWCIRAVLPHLTARGDGHIVNVASILGKRAVPGQAIYSASKFAMLGLSEALRSELASSGVTITGFCPSSTRTEMNEAISGGDPAFKQWIRTKFMATPEDVARRIVRATQRRQREVVLSPPAKLIVLLNKIAPRLLDAVFARVDGKP